MCGDFIGFEVGWMTWLARIASIASLSNGFAQASTFILSGCGKRRAARAVDHDTAAGFYLDQRRRWEAWRTARGRSHDREGPAADRVRCSRCLRNPLVARVPCARARYVALRRGRAAAALRIRGFREYARGRG